MSIGNRPPGLTIRSESLLAQASKPLYSSAFSRFQPPSESERERLSLFVFVRQRPLAAVLIRLRPVALVLAAAWAGLCPPTALAQATVAVVNGVSLPSRHGGAEPLVPLAPLARALGIEHYYTEVTGSYSLIATSAQREALMEVTPGSRRAVLDGLALDLPEAPQLLDGELWVPVASLCQHLAPQARLSFSIQPSEEGSPDARGAPGTSSGTTEPNPPPLAQSQGQQQETSPRARSSPPPIGPVLIRHEMQRHERGRALILRFSKRAAARLVPGTDATSARVHFPGASARHPGPLAPPATGYPSEISALETTYGLDILMTLPEGTRVLPSRPGTEITLVLIPPKEPATATPALPDLRVSPQERSFFSGFRIAVDPGMAPARQSRQSTVPSQALEAAQTTREMLDRAGFETSLLDPSSPEDSGTGSVPERLNALEPDLVLSFRDGEGIGVPPTAVYSLPSSSSGPAHGLPGVHGPSPEERRASASLARRVADLLGEVQGEAVSVWRDEHLLPLALVMAPGILVETRPPPVGPFPKVTATAVTAAVIAHFRGPGSAEEPGAPPSTVAPAAPSEEEPTPVTDPRYLGLPLPATGFRPGDAMPPTPGHGPEPPSQAPSEADAFPREFWYSEGDQSPLTMDADILGPAGYGIYEPGEQ